MQENLLISFFPGLLNHLDLSKNMAAWIGLLLNLLSISLLVSICFFFIRKFFHRLLSNIAARTKSHLDDYLLDNKVDFHFINIVIMLFMVSFLPSNFEAVHLDREIYIVFEALLIIAIIYFVKSILRSIKDYLKSLKSFCDKPIESYIQIFMIFAWAVAIIIFSSKITGKSVSQFLTTLGALSAILLLVFKDSILGFVASIQVTVNDTVRIGDWITMNKYDADGTVIEINLSSVKIQNFDNTITTIPTSYLTSESFINWRGMTNSGGRRIKRAIYIKSLSVHFLTDSEVNKLKNINLITDYLETRQADIAKHNTEHHIDKSLLINGRNLTNLGIFRKYLEQYLKNHAAINKNMLIMVRQLAPTAQGIPLEIYAFSQDKVWQNYEYITADIFDHAIASANYFGLELFEYTIYQPAQ